MLFSDMKKWFIWFQILFLLFCIMPFAFPQKVEKKMDPVQKFDPLLYNGRIYDYYAQPGTLGSQFLFEKPDTGGSVTIRNITYSPVELNYDVFNQLLVMKYVNSTGLSSMIEISPAWLQHFRIWGCNFSYVAASDSTKRFYQVLGDGINKFLYFHSKELVLDNMNVSGNRYFSDSKKDMYMKTRNSCLKFYNNRSFIKITNSDSREAVKQYLRKNKIRIKNADDFKMKNLLIYYNSLTY
jgi:hypothetical protein